METDRSVKSRMSSASKTSTGRSAVLEGQTLTTYHKNRQNHINFETREHSNEINRKNERLFNRLQEIHAVSSNYPSKPFMRFK